MRGARVEYDRAASRELEDAFEWYLAKNARAAESFAHEIDQAMAVSLAGPKIWPHFEAGARRYVLPRFPFSIFYREIEGGIEVVAVAHHKREPRYWSHRLSR